MIKTLDISNFKSHLSTHVRFGKLTVFTGVNGSGKTAVMQSLLLLRQSFVNNRLMAGLDLNRPLCTIGTGQDALCRHATKGVIEFNIETTDGDNMRFAYDAEKGLSDSFLNRCADQDDYPRPEELVVHPLFNNDFQYVGASRWGGRSLFPKDTFAVEQQHQISQQEGQGELVAHFLNKYGFEDVHDYCDGQSEDKSLLAQTIYWERKISPNVTLQTQPAGNNSDSFVISYGYNPTETDGRAIDGLRAENIGFGISYSLPVIVALLAAPCGGLVLIENPEAHLHPAGQAEMARLITRVAANGVQVVVETHSDHIITGLQLACKANEKDDSKGISGKDLIINFLNMGPRLSSMVQEIKMGEHGVFEHTPPGFFDQAEIDFRNLYGYGQD